MILTMLLCIAMASSAALVATTELNTAKYTAETLTTADASRALQMAVGSIPADLVADMNGAVRSPRLMR